MKEFKSIEDLKLSIEKSDSLKKELLENPANFISQVHTKNNLLDKNMFKWVIVIIGVVLIFSIIASTTYLFMYQGEEVPTFLVTIGSTSLGALVGLLSPSVKK